MEEPLGIPGHPGKTGWSRKLHEWLRDCGLSFEAEGEATRIVLGQAMIQVAEGYSVIISLTLPGTGEEAEGFEDDIARAFRIASRIAGDREIRYELDDSLPRYPMLYIMITFEDPWALAERIVTALKEYCGD